MRVGFVAITALALLVSACAAPHRYTPQTPEEIAQLQRLRDYVAWQDACDTSAATIRVVTGFLIADKLSADFAILANTAVTTVEQVCDRPTPPRSPELWKAFDDAVSNLIAMETR